MLARIVVTLALGIPTLASAQFNLPYIPGGGNQPQPTVTAAPNAWRSPSPAPAPPAQPVVLASAESEDVPVTQVTKGSGTLPNQGQVWREYDISPYTSKVTTTEKPEQAIVDWIVRETGTEAWFSDPLGILSASKDTLRVYHTPEMQRLVLDIVDRFVSSQADPYAISLRLVAVGSPNWRSTAMSLLQPVDLQTPGVDGWLLTKEHAAVLLAQMRNRTDFREYGSPNLLIPNGQSHTISRTTPKNYVRTVRMRPDVWPGHELVMGQLQEGFSLQINPLMSRDGTSMEAVVKCNIDQIEKLIDVNVDVPSAGGGVQRVQVQVPQVVSWRLHERFRWPADKVLLLSCGVVAAPTSERIGPLGIPIPSAVANLPIPGVTGRSDALLFIENKGKSHQTLLQADNGDAEEATQYHGRY